MCRPKTRQEGGIRMGKPGPKPLPVVRIPSDGSVVDAKQCRACNVIRLMDDFHRDPSRNGGRYSICRVCVFERRREQYLRYNQEKRKHK